MRVSKQATVQLTADAGLCSSCGVCKNICPKGSITYERKDGMFLPRIDEERCVRCGLCASVCPGLCAPDTTGEDALETVYGTILASFNAWSLDPRLRHCSASGGTVMALTAALLKRGLYDAAFCLDSYSYDQQLCTREITVDDIPEDWAHSSFPKSRYIPVSHEKAVRYLREHPDRRLILIASPCALRGLQGVIRTLNRDREQYLFLGLFCDSVFNYNIIDYYQQRFGGDKRLTALHFKNKDSGGWPGNMKLFYSDGSTEFQDKKERTKLKDFFMPERCLYCADKLNVCADISVGDNYTGQDSSPLGSNSVLIRTERGRKAWDQACETLEFRAFDPEMLQKAQYLSGRTKRMYFAALKQAKVEKKTGKRVELVYPSILMKNVEDYRQAMHTNLRKIRAGAAFREDPKLLQKYLDELSTEGKNRWKKIAERAYFAALRRIRS